MKKIVAFLMSLMLLLSLVNVNAAQIYYDDSWHTYEGNIFGLEIDGTTLNCAVPPIVFDGYSVVPARDVFEKAGAEVKWDNASQKVTVQHNDTKIELYINNRKAVKNGTKEQLPIPPKLINGKTMVPVRYVAEAFGFQVNFDSSTDTIKIKTKSATTYPDSSSEDVIGSEKFNLKIDGKVLNCNVSPVVLNGYSVVPARDVFEAVGATVDWNGVNQKVTIKYGNTKIELYVNNKTAKKNGVQEKLPIPPKVINGKTMIPVRYVAEAFGFDVGFDSETNTITIDTGKTTTTPVVPSNPSVPSTSSVPSAPTTPTYDTTLTSYKFTRSGDVVTAVLTFTDEVEYSHFKLTQPDRIILDTENTKYSSTVKSASTGFDDVTSIRIGQQTAGVRVVFDVYKAMKYTVSASGKTVTVKITGDEDYEKPKDETQNPTEDPVEKPDDGAENPPEVVEPVIPDPPSYKPTRTVYLDPGHGGADPGATFTDEDGVVWKECDINLSVSLKVRDILEANGVKVIMSRETNKTVGLVDRPIDANNKQAALFVSVHTNSFTADTAYGIETWGTLELSATYANVDDKILAQNIQNAVIKKTGAFSRGVKNSTGLAVLKHSIMPSVLIEVGFISNTPEREKMFTDSYRQKLADGIAEGILKTLDQMGL